MPDIKYREILDQAFGPGGWNITPRGDPIVTEKVVTREYALTCHDRYALSTAQLYPNHPYIILRPHTEIFKTSMQTCFYS